jgi:hypothetical protein
MAWFRRKTLAETPTVPQVMPSDQLREVESAFQANELEFNAACTAWKAHPWATSRVKIGNTLNLQTERPNSEGKRILAKVRETTARRDALLAERALLRGAMGL